MEPHDWDRAEALFHRLVKLDPAARAAVLDEIFTDGSPIRSELEALLAAHEDSEGALEDLQQRFGPRPG